MTLEVRCACNPDVVLDRLETGKAYVAEALVLASHVQHAGAEHRLTLTAVDPLPEPLADVSLRCLGKHCHSGDRKATTGRVPRFLVGAFTLAFHSLHEGHELKIVVDGETVHPTIFKP